MTFGDAQKDAGQGGGSVGGLQISGVAHGSSFGAVLFINPIGLQFRPGDRLTLEAQGFTVRTSTRKKWVGGPRELRGEGVASVLY